MSSLLSHYKDLRVNQEELFHSLSDSEKVREWFPELYVTSDGISIDIEKLKQNGIQYIARIKKSTPYSSISGTIESINNSEDKLRFTWTLEESNYVKNWTRLTFEFTEPVIVKQSRWWIAPIAGTAVGFIALLQNNVQTVHAESSTSIFNFASNNAEEIGTVTTKSSGITTSQIVYLSVFAVVISTGGIILPGYADSQWALEDIEQYIRMANSEARDGQWSTAYTYFENVKNIYEETGWYENHQDYAEELYMLSLAGMGNSLRLEALTEAEQTGIQIDKIKLDKAETIYKYAIDLNSDKYDIENLWIARGINAVYHDTYSTIEYCSMSDSIEGHLCQAEGYAFLAHKRDIQKADLMIEQFEIALGMTSSLEQEQDTIDRILEIGNYYNLPNSSENYFHNFVYGDEKEVSK